MARNAAPIILGLGVLGLMLAASGRRKSATVTRADLPIPPPVQPPVTRVNLPIPPPVQPPVQPDQGTIEAGAVFPPELAMTDQQIRDYVSQDASGNTIVDWSFLTDIDPVKYAPNGTHLRVLKPIYQRTYSKGSVGEAFQDAIAKAPGAISQQMADYHLMSNGAFLPLLLLPFDASASFHDRYSVMSAPREAAADQYGRGKPPGSPPAGLTWQGFTELASATWSMIKDSRSFIKAVTDNPLWKMAQTGIAFVPGIGTAVSIGMSATYAYGHDLSLQNAALGAMRDAVPGGAAGQAAFDVGVGLAQGESLSDAAVNAGRNQLPEQARAAFDIGIKAAKGQSIAPDIKSLAMSKGEAQAVKGLKGLFK